MRYQDYVIDHPSQGLRNCINFFDNLFKDVGLKAAVLESLTSFNYKNNPKIYFIVTAILNS